MQHHRHLIGKAGRGVDITEGDTFPLEIGNGFYGRIHGHEDPGIVDRRAFVHRHTQQFRAAALASLHIGNRPEESNVHKVAVYGLDHRAVALAHPDIEVEVGGPGHCIE